VADAPRTRPSAVCTRSPVRGADAAPASATAARVDDVGIISATAIAVAPAEIAASEYLNCVLLMLLPSLGE
jgi:hypothetical protein